VSATRSTIVAIVVLVVTFVSGLVVGFGVGRFGPFMRGGGHGDFAAHMMLTRLDHHLDLTTAQENQIREIFRRRHERMLEELSTANAEIERVLTPAQRQKFTKMRMHLAPPRHAR
jgi:Spy/CpxP family protein refolding chaperone